MLASLFGDALALMRLPTALLEDSQFDFWRKSGTTYLLSILDACVAFKNVPSPHRSVFIWVHGLHFA